MLYLLKKIASILLLGLLVFNLFGYRIWFCYLQQQSNKQLTANLDKTEYDDKDLITIKVPLSLPYFTNWGEFERYDGSIEVEGQHYNYVKRKVLNDTLILLCLPNSEQTRLAYAKKEFDKFVAEGKSANNNKSAGTSILKLLLTDYSDNTPFRLHSLSSSNVQSYLTTNDNTTLSGITVSPWRPPDACYRSFFI